MRLHRNLFLKTQGGEALQWLSDWLDNEIKLASDLEKEEFYYNSKSLDTFSKIKELQDEMPKEFKIAARQGFARSQIYEIKQKMTACFNSKIRNPRNVRIDEEIKALKQTTRYYENILSGIEDKNEIDDFKIAEAKRMPIENLFKIIRRDGKRAWAVCPFHNEKTASLCLYLETNSFHCFGCGESGDNLSAVQKIYNYNFIEAVKFLIN